MEYNNILYREENGIAIITINRPDKLNALNQETLAELKDIFIELKSAAGIKGVIITGSGEKAFIAGADISEFQGLNIDQAETLAMRGHHLLNAIEHMHVPVIAAVNGFALGGGCELALACHIRIASENAKMGLPEVSLGLIPGYGGTQRLTQTIGKGRALEMIMTGDMINAATALDYGLVNRVVPIAELMPTAIGLLEKIGTRGPVAVQKAIECVRACLAKDIDGFQYEINAFAELFHTKDVVEGTKAFLEKRKPDFKGH